MNEKPKAEAPAPPEKAPLILFSDAVAQMASDSDAAHEAKTTGKHRGPITGLGAVDKEIGYRLAPGLHCVNGNSGSGKTGFTLQVAGSCCFPALYVTAEMAPAELLRRFTARVTRTYLGKFTDGTFDGPTSAGLARRALESSPRLAFLDATAAPAPISHIYQCAQIVKGDAPHVLIIIDSVHSWAEGLDVDGKEYETLNAALKGLRDVSHLLKCPIMFISERNRKSAEEGGLSAGAGSRKIEYGAETVFSLDRDMTKAPDSDGESEIVLTLAKNRHGAIARPIRLKFNGGFMTFRDLSSTEKATQAVGAYQARGGDKATKKTRE